MIAAWTAAAPCPVCLHHGWCQTMAADDGGTIVMCRRAGSHPTLGEGCRKIDCTGAEYWVFRLPRGTAAPQADRPKKAPGNARPTKTLDSPNRADAETLHRIYSAVLAELPLATRHRENLQQRGLPDAEIDRRGYRSTGAPKDRRAAVKKLLRSGIATVDELRHVPGFRLERGRWTFSTPAGLLIPVRDRKRRIIALQARVDHPGKTGSRYSWVSSKRWGGPSPGAPVHHALPIENEQLEIPPSHLVRLTEGGLKADVAAALSGVVTVGMPGVGMVAAGVRAAQEYGPAAVLVAFDADAWQNPHVGRSLKLAVFTIRETPSRQGGRLQPVLETWPAEQGKGIDDCLAAGHTPTWTRDPSKIDRILADAPGDAPEVDGEATDASCDDDCSCCECRSLLLNTESIKEQTATFLPNLPNPCRKVTLHLESRTEPGRRRIARVPCRRPSCEICGPINRQEKQSWYKFIIARFWPGVWRIECRNARDVAAVKKHVERNVGWFIRFPRPDGSTTMLISVDHHRAEPLAWTDVPELLEKLIREVPEGKHITASREIAFVRLGEIKSGDWKLSPIQGALANVPVEHIAKVLRQLGLAPTINDYSDRRKHRMSMLAVDYYVPPGAWSEEDHIELLKALNPCWFWTGATSVVVRSRAPAGGGAPWLGQRRSRGGILLDASQIEPRAAAAPA